MPAVSGSFLLVVLGLYADVLAAAASLNLAVLSVFALGMATGEVVYAGSGLGGYERLVIVKHNDSYLSAYSLNQPFSVKEGQRVNGGQRIAGIGQGSTKMRMLHFEIRRDGNPVGPRTLLRRK